MMGVRVEIHELLFSGAKARADFEGIDVRAKALTYQSCPDTNQHSDTNQRFSAAYMPLQFPFFTAPSGAFSPQVSQANTMKRGLYV
jgi:hypothetical protein